MDTKEMRGGLDVGEHMDLVLIDMAVFTEITAIVSLLCFDT